MYKIHLCCSFNNLRTWTFSDVWISDNNFGEELRFSLEKFHKLNLTNAVEIAGPTEAR